MSYGQAKRDSEYSRAVFEIEAPKTVWMAIAFSLAMLIENSDKDAAVARVMAEWETLHANGIVPQKPRRSS
jgi:uncharacterized protein (DUF608 family)